MNIKMLDDEQLANLAKATRDKKYIFNTINYNILSNTRYAEAFHYEHIDQRIEDSASDFITNVLFINEDRYQNIGTVKIHKTSANALITTLCRSMSTRYPDS